MSLIERNAGDCSGAGANARADCGRNQISRDLDALDLAADEGIVARRYHAASGADESLFVNAVDGEDVGFVVGGDMDLGVERKLLDALPIGSGWGLPQGSNGWPKTTEG